MAHGDLPGLRELALEFFDDVRMKMPAWKELGSAGRAGDLREELHCCKGGASIFGLERLMALIEAYEAACTAEGCVFDLAEFEAEFAAAEAAVRNMEV